MPTSVTKPIEQLRAIEVFKGAKGVKGTEKAVAFLQHAQAQGVEAYATIKGARAAVALAKEQVKQGQSETLARMVNIAATQNNYAAFIAAVTLQNNITGVTVMETRRNDAGEKTQIATLSEDAQYTVPHSEFSRFMLGLQSQTQTTKSGKPSRHAKALAECINFAEKVKAQREA